MPAIVPAPSRRRRRYRWLWSLVICLVLAVPLLLASLMGMIYWQARTAELVRSDAIVVLGAAQWNGRPSDVLEARLERALELFEAGYAPLIVVTGGNQPGDAYTEAETSRLWLEERGVPSAAIVEEDESRSTWENLQGADRVLEGRGVDSLLIVSDGFHLFRAELMARHLGFEVHSAPVEDGPIGEWSSTEFSYVVRETGAVIAFLPELV